jgi:NADP-dependent 3-hydroxy acid dehydrogenase YdfG
MGAAAPRSLVITRVSTGIGHAVAKLAVAQGWSVFGSVRNEADVERLTKVSQLEKCFNNGTPGTRSTRSIQA